jgi:VWFA-related protein
LSLPRVGLLISLMTLPGLRLAAQNAGGPAPDAAAQTPATTSSAASPAAQSDPGEPVMTLHATVRAVVLDVAVTDGEGRPVKGLKAPDFALSEDGVPQTLLSFTEHDGCSGDAAGAPAPAPQPDTSGGRASIADDCPKNVIVLGNLGFADAPFVRDQLKELAKTIAPGTPVAIFRTDWQGLHLVQDLTTDPKVLREAVASERILPPVGFPVRYLRRKGRPDQWLASYLAAIPGRINLIWLGSGFTMAAPFPDVASTHGELKLSRVALYPIDASGVVNGSVLGNDTGYATGISGGDVKALAISTGGMAFGSAVGLSNGIKDEIAAAIDHGSHFYTVSYRPTSADWNGKFRKIKIVTSVEQAESTWDEFWDWMDYAPRVSYRDGYFARSEGPNRAPPKPSIQPGKGQAGRDSASGQRRLISYSPKGDPGTPGYTLHTAMQTAMSFGVGQPPYQIPFEVTVTPSLDAKKLKAGVPMGEGNSMVAEFSGLPYRTCRIRYWVDPANLHFAESVPNSFHASLEFVAVVYRDDGSPVSSSDYATAIDVDGAKLARLMKTGFTFDQSIAMPVAGNPLPGRFFLRAGVHELSSDRVSVIMVPSEAIRLPAPSDPFAGVRTDH